MKKEEDFIDIKEILALLRRYWWWIPISVFVALLIAGAYVITTPNVYTRKASVLIKDENKGKGLSSDVSSAFADMGLMTGNVNVNNELLTMQSPMLITEVVKRLDLQSSYTAPSTFHRQTLYGSSLPVRLKFLDLPETATASVEMDIASDGSVRLNRFVRDGEELPAAEVSLRAGTTASTALGRIELVRDSVTQLRSIDDVRVSRRPLYATVEGYTKAVRISMTDEKSTVLELAIEDESIERADDFLTTLIGVYNEKWLADKNVASMNASQFIDDRLKYIVQDLGVVDRSITTFKSKNLLPDVEEASKLYMSQMGEISTQIVALSGQERTARHIRNMLRGQEKYALLPVNGSLQNPAIEKQISEYNELLLKRNNLASNSSEHNSLVQDIDKSLEALRPAIITSLDNQLLAIQTQIKVLEQSEARTTSRVAASPEQANFLLSEGRQQKVKEALYLYLLQKREENELSQAFTASNTRIISVPNGSPQATFPQKRNIFVAAFVLGLIIPVVVIYLRAMIDTKVHSRRDVEDLTIPFVGELPEVAGERNRLGRRKKSSEEDNSVLVMENGRDIINEAFRSVRTNLEFMFGRVDGCRVVMGTSLVPGSGKTFIALNLAKSFALKGKRVLIIDLDVRRARTSRAVGSPHIGLVNYLSGHVNSLTDILRTNVLDGVVDIIPVGTIPPNPTELLELPVLAELMAELRTKYDLIFLDCPPVEVVADVDIIKGFADLTLFVVRANTIDKVALPHIEEYYTSHRFGSMGLILNGVSDYHRRYGYGNYSYNTD